MSIRRPFGRSGRILFGLAAAAAGLALLAPAVAVADAIPVTAMARGTSVSQAECAALPQAVWVNALGRTFCMRYYLSTAGGQGPRPVVFLQGDKPWKFDRATGAFVPPADAKDLDTRELEKFADGFSRSARTTAIYLARVGVDGSSGHHRIRHSFLELHATNAALDAIKERHNFDGFHLVGQSGGATLVAGLLGLRNDIGCAVPGAGRLTLLREDRRAIEPDLRSFDAADAIPSIARHSTARILVVTDPLDQRVGIEHQIAFVQKLRQAGGRVEQYFVEATDENRHGMVAYTRPAVAGCIRGADYWNIRADLAKVETQRLTAKAKADAAAKAKAEAEGKPKAEPEGKPVASDPPMPPPPASGARVSTRKWWQRYF